MSAARARISVRWRSVPPQRSSSSFTWAWKTKTFFLSSSSKISRDVRDHVAAVGQLGGVGLAQQLVGVAGAVGGHEIPGAGVRRRQQERQQDGGSSKRVDLEDDMVPFYAPGPPTSDVPRSADTRCVFRPRPPPGETSGRAMASPASPAPHPSLSPLARGEGERSSRKRPPVSRPTEGVAAKESCCGGPSVGAAQGVAHRAELAVVLADEVAIGLEAVGDEVVVAAVAVVEPQDEGDGVGAGVAVDEALDVAVAPGCRGRSRRGGRRRR